jgi:hypothetical protein
MASVPGVPARRARRTQSRAALKNLTLGAISALAAFLLVSSPGCGTDAKGVEDCRDIELARCEAAAPCGIVTDVAECKRYYRDHCLHGLAVESPPRNLVDECVGTVKRAGQCAQLSGPDTPLDYCPELVTRKAILATTACDIVHFPERADECSFLLPVPLEEPAGEGGQGGQSTTEGTGGA